MLRALRPYSWEFSLPWINLLFLCLTLSPLSDVHHNHSDIKTCHHCPERCLFWWMHSQILLWFMFRLNGHPRQSVLLLLWFLWFLCSTFPCSFVNNMQTLYNLSHIANQTPLSAACRNTHTVRTLWSFDLPTWPCSRGITHNLMGKMKRLGPV